MAKLVSASERPEMRYRITILNSASVNAFALPSGNLYVTRGLMALANDASELASVLSHEMSHVIARHAEMREDEAKQVALVTRVFTDLNSDPETSALALAKSKIKLASFSRAQEFEADAIGIGIAARAGYDPYGAVRFLTSMGRNAELKSSSGQSHADPRAQDFLSSHPATPERIKNAQTNARQFAAATGTERDKKAYLAGIDGIIYGEDPSEGFTRGRRFLHPRLGFTFVAPEGFTLDNSAQAVLGIREGGGQALRCQRGAGAARANTGRISQLRMDREYRSKNRRGDKHQRASRGDRDCQGGPVGISTLCGSVRHRCVSFHIRQQEDECGSQPCIPRGSRDVPPHQHCGKPVGKAAAFADHHRRAG